MDDCFYSNKHNCRKRKLQTEKLKYEYCKKGGVSNKSSKLSFISFKNEACKKTFLSFSDARKKTSTQIFSSKRLIKLKEKGIKMIYATF